MYTMVRTGVHQRMANIREAFRLQRLAHERHGMWLFYLEHNIFDEARESRLAMLDCLRGARQQWREALGLAG